MHARISRVGVGAVRGLLAGGAGVAVAQLTAAIIRPESGPLITVGGAVVDATPTPVKEFAVRQFGTNDKLVLMLSIGVVLAAFAALFGILGRRRAWLGYSGAALFGLVGVSTAATRPSAQGLDIVPAIAGGAAAILALWVLQRTAPASAGRRAFLRTGGLIAVAAFVGVWLSNARRRGAEELRASFTLPKPSSGAGPRNAATGFYTPNAEFYRVDTALTVPRIDPSTWRLRIHGLVEHELSLDLTALAARPAVERDVTLNCVSNEVGGPYISTARWLGILLAPLLREAGIHRDADQIVARSVDGMTIGTPLATALDGRDTLLAFGMNGEPLPLEHGFPVRMLTPGLYGHVGACKWLVDLELTRFDAYDPYWVKRGWAPQAPVKTASRIDRPRPLSTVSAGSVEVKGVAWAQHRGIRSVEVQVDDQPWRPAHLLPAASTTRGCNGCTTGMRSRANTSCACAPPTAPAHFRPTNARRPSRTAPRAGTRSPSPSPSPSPSARTGDGSGARSQDRCRFDGVTLADLTPSTRQRSVSADRRRAAKIARTTSESRIVQETPTVA